MKSLFLIFILFIVSSPLFACNSASPNELSDTELEKKVARMIMLGFDGLELNDSSWIITDIQQKGIGGVILFDYHVPKSRPVRNVESFNQLKKLVDDLQELSHERLLIAIDQEGGRVNRLKQRFGFPTTVSHQFLGELNNPDTTRYYASKTATLLRDLGIHFNFAPVVDVNTNPNNPVIGRLERSFSSNPEQVVFHSSIFLEEHRNAGVLGAAKHFPGHGSAWNDSHFGLADVTDTWDELELIPYQQLIEQNLLDVVMSAHIFNENWNTEHPATLVPEVMTQMLRNDLGFNGLLVSDDMQMGAITDFYGTEKAVELAINAGIDLLIFANNSVYDPDIATKIIQSVVQMVRDGRISESRILEANNRLDELHQKLDSLSN